MVVKDVRGCAALFRFTLGRWGLRRELGFSRKLEGFPRVPRCLGRLDADAILFERVAAEPLHRGIAERAGPGFFAALEAWIGELHRRGIVHLDLRQKRNILVGDDGKPWIVDFASAIDLGGSWLSRRLLLPLLAWVDRSAVLKFRVRYLPQLASEEERRRNRRVRWIRRLWLFTPHRSREG